MSQVLVNYHQIFGDITTMRREIQNEIIQMQNSYQQCQHALTAMDGKGNFAIREAMAANMTKATTTVDTLEKLLLFMDAAARETQQADLAISHIFNASHGVRKGANRHA